MALMQHYSPIKQIRRVYNTQSDSDRKENSGKVRIPPELRSPAEQLAPLANTFQRRLLLGLGTASVVALGANFTGVTSFLLGLSPEIGRNLKLDVIYPIRGYNRCIDTDEGFEFIYPATWVGDQTLLYRAIGKAELERSLDPPPLNAARRRDNVNEPIVAFGPPGTTGELNISVIVSQVPQNFSIEAFGGVKEVGEAILQTVVAASRRPDVSGTLVESTMKEDTTSKVKYYKVEFKVESPSFQRHNVAICCARREKLFTLNAQSPEYRWSEVKSDFYTVTDSFTVTS